MKVRTTKVFSDATSTNTRNYYLLPRYVTAVGIRMR